MIIKNEIQYQAALSRANNLMNVTYRQAEGIEYTALIDDIVAYEHSVFGERIDAVKSSI